MSWRPSSTPINGNELQGTMANEASCNTSNHIVGRVLLGDVDAKQYEVLSTLKATVEKHRSVWQTLLVNELDRVSKKDAASELRQKAMSIG